MNMDRLHRSSRRLLLADYEPGGLPHVQQGSDVYRPLTVTMQELLNGLATSFVVSNAMHTGWERLKKPVSMDCSQLPGRRVTFLYIGCIIFRPKHSTHINLLSGVVS